MAARYFSTFQRGNIPHDRPRYDPPLPSYSSAVREKMYLQPSSQTRLIPLPSPFSSNTRRIRLRSQNPRVRFGFSRVGRRRGFCRCLVIFVGFCVTVLLLTLLGTEESHWTPPFRDSTLVFGRENLQRIWKWEIESGHYPSNRKSKRQCVRCFPDMTELSWSPRSDWFHIYYLESCITARKGSHTHFTVYASAGSSDHCY